MCGSGGVERGGGSRGGVAAQASNVIFQPTTHKQTTPHNQIYPAINDGVYRCGFATTQAAYDAAAAALTAGLRRADALLAVRRFLAGDKFTEADLRLFPTVVRFDAAYAGLFRCGRVRVADLPHLQAWMRDVWQIRVEGSPLQVRARRWWGGGVWQGVRGRRGGWRRKGGG